MIYNLATCNFPTTLTIMSFGFDCFIYDMTGYESAYTYIFHVFPMRYCIKRR